MLFQIEIVQTISNTNSRFFIQIHTLQCPVLGSPRSRWGRYITRILGEILRCLTETLREILIHRTAKLSKCASTDLHMAPILFHVIPHLCYLHHSSPIYTRATPFSAQHFETLQVNTKQITSFEGKEIGNLGFLYRSYSIGDWFALLGCALIYKSPRKHWLVL